MSLKKKDWVTGANLELKDWISVTMTQNTGAVEGMGELGLLGSTKSDQHVHIHMGWEMVDTAKWVNFHGIFKFAKNKKLWKTTQTKGSFPVDCDWNSCYPLVI